MDTLIARMPVQQSPRIWQPWLVNDADNDRSHATKDLPTTRWRRERRCKDRLGDYSKFQQNKAAHNNTNEASADAVVTRTGDTPLDMTTSRNGKPPPPYSQSVTGYPRPSVITCAPPATTAWGDHHRSTNKDDTARQGHRRELLSGMCDPVIDEHFRRSLGKDYNSLFSSDDGTTNNNSDYSNSSSSITVTGLSVDDHFAKALGETWVKLQGQRNGSAASVPKDKKSSTSTATVSLSVAKKDSTTTPSTAVPTTTTTLRRGLVSI